jgi:hypothetical protein
MLRMAMVTPALAPGASVVTIEEKRVIMAAILGERRGFVNGETKPR